MELGVILVTRTGLVGTARLVTSSGRLVRSVEALCIPRDNMTRIRALRAAAERPPNTTATTWRPSRRADASRLKPEAIV
jgi:hypothetical protein